MDQSFLVWKKCWLWRGGAVDGRSWIEFCYLVLGLA
jgi:hypothetical protein